MNAQFPFTIPIIQAPMAGGIMTPELVAAVSNTGALGSLGAGYMMPHGHPRMPRTCALNCIHCQMSNGVSYFL